MSQTLPTAVAERLPQPVGATRDSVIVHQYRLTNVHGMQMDVWSMGGIVTKLTVPDRNGKFENVVLSCEHLAFYESSLNPYFGALIGRYGNRIGHGRFTLDNKTYKLAQNNGENHLHGGVKGYDKRVWNVKPIPSVDGAALELTLTDPDGMENYPGTVRVKVIYTLTNDNAWRIDYEATADAATPINLTQHAYFNLKDCGKTDVLGHDVTLNCDGYTAVDASLIPTGEIAPVINGPMDFTKPKSIGKDLHLVDAMPQGYDHNFVIRGKAGDLRQCAEVYEPTSGRVMKVFTTEPAVQLYTGNFLDGTITGRDGAVYHQHHGMCLETQHYPDSPNKPQFPNTILRPGATYRSRTEYRFSTR